MFYTEGSDACENTLMRSSIVDSFDIIDTVERSWYVTADVKTARFYKMDDFSLALGCDFDGDCGGDGDASGVCNGAECICGNEYYGLRCDFDRETTCTYLEIDEGILGGTRSYAQKYSVLRDPTGELIFFYHKPIFLSERTSKQSPDIIFYSGYRWILTRTWERFLVDPSVALTNVNIANFFSTTFPEISSLVEGIEYLVSEPVRFNTASDEATPQGLQWYIAKRFNSIGDEVILQGPLDPKFFAGYAVMCRTPVSTPTYAWRTEHAIARVVPREVCVKILQSPTVSVTPKYSIPCFTTMMVAIVV